MLETNNTNITVSVQTDPGCVREANEDSGRHVNPNDADVRERRGTLTIVADGMGGHASGEVASQMAVELISELYYSLKNLSAPEALRAAVEQANSEIFNASASDEKYFGMGTTVIALALQNGQAFSAHVGDSRLYRFRKGELEMMTLDHSQVMEMVKHGIISMEEARDHDDKNVILRAVGTQKQVEVDVSEPFAVEVGDTFLLCSDGLNDMLTDAEMHAILIAEPDIHTACEKLIEAAKQNGGHDNITAGIVRISESEPQASASVKITREITI
jgi:protein phosphatase